ncbi:Trm112 family protein [Arthrobacter sp. M4]|uniref:Trm112 family protein n=1 Tax=Arthrobacter sp. M4 TaxID=218160 RepID=UPI001CDB6964|nr:Trm112 family protein [Arthrobacter sp. M4]MCA4133575.1 hypothetical protein [Arthrobacter sp. M4]
MPKVSPELLSILRCPVTHSSLVQEGDELVSTADGPSGGKVRYAIEDGIPLLLPPAEPVQDNAPGASQAASATADPGPDAAAG